jgi:hypothetical protein
MKMSETVYPGPQDIADELDAAARSLKGGAVVKPIGKSVDGRDILSCRLTDPSVSDDLKQHALIVAGQHGNEESGRLGALAVLRWLCSDDPEAAETRRRQVVLVIPALNVDGAAVNRNKNSNDVNLNREYDPAAAERQPEAAALMRLAEDFIPDMMTDMHGLGGGGCDDMILIGGARPYTEDIRLHHAIALEMVENAERAGWPVLAHPMDWNGWNLTQGNCLVGWMYWRFHPITFLTEGNETTRSPEEMAVSGFVRMKPLILAGNRRHPWFRCEGYPNGIIGGVVNMSVRSWGRTPGERRRNRAEVWPQMDRFPRVGRGKAREGSSELTAQISGDKPFENGIALALRVIGRPRIECVSWDGAELKASEDTPGYVTWTDACSTFIQLNLPGITPGDHAGEVRWKGKC